MQRLAPHVCVVDCTSEGSTQTLLSLPNIETSVALLLMPNHIPEAPLSALSAASVTIQAVPADFEPLVEALLGPSASIEARWLPLPSDDTASSKMSELELREQAFASLTAGADALHASASAGQPQVLIVGRSADTEWAHACICAYAIRWRGMPAAEALHLIDEGGGGGASGSGGCLK